MWVAYNKATGESNALTQAEFDLGMTFGPPAGFRYLWTAGMSAGLFWRNLEIAAWGAGLVEKTKRGVEASVYLSISKQTAQIAADLLNIPCPELGEPAYGKRGRR